MKTTTAAGVLALVLTGSATATFGQGATPEASSTEIGSQFNLNIDSQPLGRALNEFGKQSGLHVVIDSELVRGIVSKEVRGRYAADRALSLLLADTGLRYRFVDGQTVAIVKANAPAQVSTYNDLHTGAVQLARADAPASAKDSGPGESQRTSTQENDRSTIQEIIVTATKRTERLQDVPQSIAVVTQQDIERRGVSGMADYLRSIPGVNETDTGGRDNTIVIRGITTSIEFQNASNNATVASYFDETPITGAGGSGGGGVDIRTVDIERIEVLRGPQGTTFGNSSLGGAMRIIPAKPQLTHFGGKVAGAYSSTAGDGSDSSMVQGVLNIPLVTDKFALRAVGYRYEDSGYYRNVAGTDPATLAAAAAVGLTNVVSGFVQDDVGRTVTNGGRLAALWQATDNMSLSANLLSQTSAEDGRPVATSGEFRQVRTPLAVEDQVRGHRGEFADSKMKLADAVLNYDFRWAALTSAVSWIDSRSEWSQAFDHQTIDLPSSNARSRVRSFTAETRLASKFAGRFQFLGGVFYEAVKSNYRQAYNWPGSPATNPHLFNPMVLSISANELRQPAVFGELSYDLTDTLTATVGGRYFKYKRDNLGIPLTGGLVNTQPAAAVPAPTGVDDHGSTFKANLSYKPTEDALLYLSWSQGFRLGPADRVIPPTGGVCDVNNDGIVDGTTGVTVSSTAHVDADALDNYEIGAKVALFDRRLTIDTAVYHIAWDGLPFNVRPVNNCTFLANAGTATSDGVELQASVAVTKGLKFDFGAGYTQAQLTKDVPVPGFRDGDRLPGTPKVSANLAAQYDFDMAGHKAFVRADSLYTGSFYGNLAQTPSLRAGDYIKLDARAGVEIGAASVELFVRNLTNEDAYTWRGQGGTSSALAKPFFGYQLRPRTIGLQLGYDFE